MLTVQEAVRDFQSYDIYVTTDENGTMTDTRDNYGVTYREYCVGANDIAKSAVDAYMKSHPNGKVAANSNRIMIVAEFF